MNEGTNSTVAEQMRAMGVAEFFLRRRVEGASRSRFSPAENPQAGAGPLSPSYGRLRGESSCPPNSSASSMSGCTATD